MRTVTSVASMTVYTKLPGIVTKYTGKEGWWVGNNLKFNRAGWGGNGATGARSAAKAIGSRIGLATKVLERPLQLYRVFKLTMILNMGMPKQEQYILLTQ